MTFNERLAHLADRAREVNEGLGKELMRFIGDLDAHLDQQRNARYDSGAEMFRKWNEFLNASLIDRDEQHKKAMVAFRRKLAQAVAADPHWQGSYADALKLLDV